MASQLNSFAGGFLTPAPVQATLQGNYLGSNDFDFIRHELPDLDAAEFERYGNRSMAGFLQLVGAELPTNSDLIKWVEQGRLHTKYENCIAGAWTSGGEQIFDIGTGTCTFRVGQTVFLSSATDGVTKKGVISALPAADTFTVEFYTDETAAAPFTTTTTTDITAFVYGSEFRKGADGMQGSNNADVDVYEVKPIIIKDTYEVAGSDMSQIGWIETTTEEGDQGYYWFLKSESETRVRFNDYLEMALIEGVPAENGSAAETELSDGLYAGSDTIAGTDGLFYSVEQRGNVWAGGNPTTIADFDTMIHRMDKQGSIEENMLFIDRGFDLDIDDMLAGQNSYGAGGTSYGVFNNDKEMALNLGFEGFMRGGYEFYKTDWKYLNDPTLRGNLDEGGVSGVLVPAGQTTVYDQVLGRNATRPYLHVRYRASEHENRRYKSWVTGSAGGARTSSVDLMTVDFLSERALCTMGANNFFIFND
jgi:hypothetical protein